MSFAYSKNIHERFSKVDQDSSQASIDWYETNSTTSDLMPPSLNITEGFSNPFRTNKIRYIIFYSKCNESSIHSYIKSKNCFVAITK